MLCTKYDVGIKVRGNREIRAVFEGKNLLLCKQTRAVIGAIETRNRGILYP
jgi:hypothetical protein